MVNQGYASKKTDSFSYRYVCTGIFSLPITDIIYRESNYRYAESDKRQPESSNNYNSNIGHAFRSILFDSYYLFSVGTISIVAMATTVIGFSLVWDTIITNTNRTAGAIPHRGDCRNKQDPLTSDYTLQ